MTATPEWQPIETAPHTTRAILVWCPAYQNIYIVNWITPYGEIDGRWEHFGGGNGHMLNERPTRWMPLPESPS